MEQPAEPQAGTAAAFKKRIRLAKQTGWHRDRYQPDTGTRRSATEAVSLDHKHAVFVKSPCCKHSLSMRNQGYMVNAAFEK
jgi:hypothetical protein